MAIFYGAVLVCGLGLLEKTGINVTGLNLMENSLGRISSTLGHPNYLAYFVVIWLPVIAAFFFTYKKRKLMVFGFLILLAALIFTASRAAFFGLVFGLMIFLVIMGAIKKKKIYFAAVVPGLILVIIGAFLFDFGNSRSTESRFHIYSGTVQLIAEKPVFGHGLETFQIAFPKYANRELLSLEKIDTTADRAHNTFLQMGADLGFLGIISYFYLLFTVFSAGISAVRKANENGRIMAAGTLSSLTALFVSIQFGFIVTVHFVSICFLLAYLIFLVSGGIRERKLEFLKRRAYRVGFLIFISIFVFGAILTQNVFTVLAERNFSPILNPNQSYYNYVWSSYFYDKGDIDRAIAFAEKGGEYNSFRDGFIHMLAGKNFGAKCAEGYKEYCEKAKQSFDTASGLMPNFPNIYLNRGKFYLRIDECGLAFENLNKYLSLVPDYWKNPGSEEYRLFLKHNPDFEEVFSLMEVWDHEVECW